jgi:hypothetical protein
MRAECSLFALIKCSCGYSWASTQQSSEWSRSEVFSLAVAGSTLDDRIFFSVRLYFCTILHFFLFGIYSAQYRIFPRWSLFVMVLVGWRHHLLLRQRLIPVPSVCHGTGGLVASPAATAKTDSGAICLSWYWWVGGIICCYGKD